jgi:centromere protein X
MATGGGSAAREKISPDLVQQIFQLKWEEDEKERAAEAAAEADRMAEEGQGGDEDGGGGGNQNNNATAAAAGGSRGAKKFSIKDEAVAASAEVLRHFAAEIVQRAAEVAYQVGW